MAQPMPEVPGVEHRYADVNGFRMHYAEAGSGEPVMLVHGWPQHWWAWRHVIPPLAERYRVIVPDLRGYGWSEVPDSGYDKPQFAADLVSLMDALGIEKVKYAGYDWGGAAAYILATDHPDRVERVAGIAVPPPFRSGPPPPQLMAVFLTYQSLVSSPILGAFAMRRGFGGVMLKAGRSHGSFTDAELAVYDDRWKEGDRAKATVGTYRTFLLKEFPAQIRGASAGKRLDVPTLVVMGGRDLLKKALQPEVYEKKGDDVRTAIIDDCGHWVPEEQPEELTRILLDFFAEP
jgi:pimeloyl-ACP methyl ester carboxylesterase